jgi:excisionase family DNA binding protein|tara:strand:+ start:441 stop:716 length:276 start_codon:yes stop_codon:yes gene_type:complete
MSNPFESINERFDRIENILLEIIEKPQEESKPDNLTVKETAEYLKVSEQSIHSYIKKGFIKAHKMGRIYLIKRTDIEEALKEVKSLKYKRS